MEKILEEVGEGAPEQDHEENVCSDVRELYCGDGVSGNGSIAPCTYCEWCGICPQHSYHPEHRTA